MQTKTSIYRRVSEEEQAQSMHGLNAQEDATRLFAERNGWDVRAIFTDPGLSGGLGLEKRPALLEAIASLQKGDVLLVAKRDRLGRLDPVEMAMIESAVRRRGARIVSAAGEGTENDDPSNILMRTIIDAFSRYEKLVIGHRTKSALQSKKKRGERVGGIPYGFDVAADGKMLVANEDEQEVLRLIRELRTDGVTLQGIACELQNRGIRRRGSGRWDHSFVSRLLKRAA
jgi:site-specific DNA recombinase